MAEDVTSLVLKVESNQVGKASKELDKLSQSGKKTTKATDGVASSFKKLIGPLIATVSAVQGLRKLVAITREFDILNAQLVTATGSAENAAVAFEAIQDFATTTPFQLAEVTSAFVTLVNRGLDPSEDALVAIGNLAAATGSNIKDMTRAVAQATVGEYESIRTLTGATFKSVGDEFDITFRGATTRVGKTTKEIQDYFLELGRTDFGGAMEARLDTLDGALSNLQDSWDKFWLSLSQGGSGAVIEEAVRGLILSIETLTTMLSTGDATDGLDEVFFRAEDIRDAFVTVALISSKTFKGIQAAAKTGEVAFLSLADVINTIFYGTLIGGSEILETVFNAPVEGVNKLIDAINGLPAWMRPDGASIEPIKFEFDIDTESMSTMSEAIPDALKMAQDEWTALANELDGFDEKFIAKMNAAMENLGATSDRTKDRLAGFSVGGDADPKDPNAFTDAEAKATRDKYDRLVESLMTEEEAIQASYEKRMGTAKEYAKLTEESVADIEARIKKQKQAEIAELNKQRWSTALSSFDDFQQNILVLARTGSKELAAVYKAAAIANTLIKTYESATSAFAAMASIPVVGPALGTAAAAAAVAAGMANIQAINSTPVGQYAGGGVIPGTSFAGDQLTANVNSGEMVLNRDQQNRLFKMANGQGNGTKSTVINVQNFGTGEVEVEERDAGDARVIDIAVGRAKRETKREIASDIRTGSGDVSRSMESSFNLKRGTA